MSILLVGVDSSIASPPEPLGPARHSLTFSTTSSLQENRDPEVAIEKRTSPSRSPNVLTEEIDRDVYNQLAELNWLLEAGLWKQAAELVSKLDTTNARGVAPAADDDSLLVSLPAAIRQALRHWPPLVAQLEQDYGDMARLRIERAVRETKPRFVEQWAERYLGTSAARRGWLWLGDQELARGNAQRAMRWYRQAVATPNDVIDDHLAARLSLAAALAGTKSPGPITRPVPLGDYTLTPDELIQITTELSARNASSNDVHSGSLVASRSIAKVTIDARYPLPILAGQNPRKRESAVAYAIAQELLLVNDGFQLYGLDSASGELQWTSQPLQEELPSRQNRPPPWAAPLAHNDRVMARQLGVDTLQLACWDHASGRLLWAADLGEQLPVSDPFLLDRQLAVLAMGRERSVDSVLQLVLLDWQTGQTTRSTPLLRLKSAWWHQMICQVATCEDRFFAELGGVTFSGDSEGSVRWIRTASTSPHTPNRAGVPGRQSPLMVQEDQLILVQKGAATVEALDLYTGALSWQTELPDVEQIVGSVAQSMIVQATTGLYSLDTASGKIAWHHADNGLLPAVVCREPATIVYTRVGKRQKGEAGRPVEFVWLSPSNGTVVKSLPIEGLTGRPLTLGPLVTDPDRTWLYCSDAAPTQQHELIKLRMEETPAEPP